MSSIHDLLAAEFERDYGDARKVEALRASLRIILTLVESDRAATEEGRREIADAIRAALDDGLMRHYIEHAGRGETPDQA